MEGTKRGRLTFIDIAYIRKQATFWNCKCDCGNNIVVWGSGKTKSCGCLAKETKSINGKKNRNNLSPVDFIKSNIEVDDETKCWNWTKSLIDGYARISGRRGRKSVIASRYVYEHIKGEDPGSLQVCHTCDNPKCVNPDHLFLGTQIENFQDMKNKKRSACGVKNFKSKLTEKEVLQIRKIQNKLNPKEIAEIYGVAISTIRRILNRKTWTHI